MDENQTNVALVQALQAIQNELQRMNQTLSALAAQQGRPAPAARPASTRPAAPRTMAPRAPRETGYSRPERTEDSDFGSERPTRYPKKTGGAFPKAKPKGKLPPKKGDGYPKKPR